MRTKQKNQINFEKKFSKLEKDNFTTVRWLDSKYELGSVCELFFVVQNWYHTKYGKGKARIQKIEIKKMHELSCDFIKEDSDCDRLTFFQMMEKWYSKKPDWKGWDSEVQILYLERCKGVI